MKNTKKIIMAVLALALVGGAVFMPSTVGFVDTSVVVNAASTYTFENGVLTITGTGKMTDIYDSDIRNNTKEIIVNEGITSLSDSLAYNYQALEKVTLPHGITKIPDGVFMNLSKLKEVVLPDNLETIGFSVFYKCPLLESIELPSSLKNITGGSFKNAGLKEVTIPANVQMLDGGTFTNCTSLESITFEGLPSINTDFSGSNALKEVRFTSQTPLAFTNNQYRLLNNLSANVTVYIPVGSTYNGTPITKENASTVFRNAQVKFIDIRASDVSYNADPAYMVTIPAGVELNNTDVDANITAENVLLENDKHIVVKLTGAANTVNDDNFTVATAEGASTTYQIKKDGETLRINDDAARFVYDGTTKTFTQDLTFTAPGAVEYAGTYRDTLTFTVSVETPVHVTSVSLDKTTLDIDSGSTATLTATVNPDNATFSKVTWTSSDESVVTVDKNGLVTTVSIGKATITATAEGKSASCTVRSLPTDRKTYTKDSPEIAGGVILNFGDVINTEGTSQQINVTSQTILSNDTSSAYWYAGEKIYYVNKFWFEDGRLYVNRSGVAPDYWMNPASGKTFKVSYNSEDNYWYVDQVDIP